MKSVAFWCLAGLFPLWAGELPDKAAGYHEALMKRPESAALFQRFRDAWLEERDAVDLEKELLARAEAGEAGDWAVLARARAVAGNDAGALTAYQKARTAKPAAWLDLEIARLQLAARDFAAAETSALAVPATDKLYPEAMKVAGLACLRGDRVEQALACWRKAVDAAPGDHGLLEELTELTRREGRVDLALDYNAKWRDAVDDAYGKAMATLRRSELLLAGQRFDVALAELAAVMRVAGDGSWLEREVIARSEQVFRQRGGIMQWAEWMGARADENPARLGFRRAHARALAAAGKPDEALVILAEVLKRSPGDLSVRWERVGLLERALKLNEAFAECGELAAAEKSEAAGLRLAELAFRLERKDEVKRALDAVLAAADPAKRVSLTGLYAKYGLPEESERLWRDAAHGESGGMALRELAKSLRSRGRMEDAIEVWKQLAAREVVTDRIEAAQMLAACGGRDEARRILTESRGRFEGNPDVESALAELAVLDGKPEEALLIYQGIARAARRPDALALAQNGWLRAAKTTVEPLRNLGDETADRCLRAAFLAETGAALPAVRDGDELERAARLALLRQFGRWAELVGMMEAAPGERSPLFLSELAEAKTSAGDLAGALEAARSWWERAMEQPGPWLREADVLEKLGKTDEAAMVLRRAAARFEDNEDTARALFRLLETRADPGEALELAWFRHDRTQDDSVRGDWRRLIMNLSEEKNRLEDLRHRLNEYARRDPASPWPLLALAGLAEKHGDANEELSFLRRAAVNAPQDVSLLSSLAGLEERMGNSPEALRLHSEITRLSPGPDAIRQLARIKIRLGDVDGGLRDLRTLVGENRIDLRQSEEAAGELAAWGFVEEAIQLLSAVDPSKRDARSYFVLGCLMETDGREREALDAYAKVLTEPDDPAEKTPAYGYYGEPPQRTMGVWELLASRVDESPNSPGSIQGLRVPGSLREAKQSVRSRLFRMGMNLGGETWAKVGGLVPELGQATIGQWRAVDFFISGGRSAFERDWLVFLNAHPGNPLGVDLLIESGYAGRMNTADLQALLNRTPPLTVRQQLKLRFNVKVDWSDNLKFLNRIPAEAWQEPDVASLALGILLRDYSAWDVIFDQADSMKPCLAMLAEAKLQGTDAGRLADLTAALALMNGNEEMFIKRLDSLQPPVMEVNGWDGAPLLWQTFRIWSGKVPVEKRDQLIARIQSPIQRCRLSFHLKQDELLALVDRELAALPAGAPAEVRRELAKLRISLLDVTRAKDELEKIAADDSDPHLAFTAMAELAKHDRENASKPEVRARMVVLLGRIRYMSGASGAVPATGYGYRRGGLAFLQPPANRWGAGGMLSSGSAQDGRRMQQVLEIKDKELAGREAAKCLMRLAILDQSGQSLAPHIDSLRRNGLLDSALNAIPAPMDAGLCRKVGVLRLMNAVGGSDRGLLILSDLARTRPWETNWSIDLALRTADAGQRKLLLDGVADRPNFDKQLIAGLNAMPAGAAENRVLLLERLADWAASSGKSHAWVGDVLLEIARGEAGLKKLADGGEAQLACYRRYLDLAFHDPCLAEFAFRLMHAMRHLETPEAVAEAARRALLSGAYAAGSSKTDLVRLCGSAGNLKHELAALEHLVIIAGEQGDQAAFPEDFRGKLKSVDKDISAWLDKLLAAGKAAGLPDVSNVNAMNSPDWTVIARHEAAVLRAENLPGRDEWLGGVFREKHAGVLSTNLSQVIRASLMDAARSGSAGKRAMAWHEAEAGPSARWDEASRRNLAVTTKLVMDAVSRSDLPVLLQVLESFRENKVCVSDSDAVFSNLGRLVWTESRKPGAPDFTRLLGPDTESLFRLGYWQSTGKGIFWNWALPATLGGVVSQMDARNIGNLEKQADPSFVELMMLRYCSSGIDAEKKALIKAAPVLAKLPKMYREAVVTSLTAEMTPADLKGLPDFAIAITDLESEKKRSERLEQARKVFGELRKRGGALPDAEVARLLAPVLLDDAAFVNEVIEAWKPVAEKDRSGGRMANFAYSLISPNPRDARLTMAAVRIVESLNGGKLPAAKPGRTDLMDSLVENLGHLKSDVNLWREVAAMSPTFQIRFWMGCLKRQNGTYSDQPEDAEMMREAVPKESPSRPMLEWYLQSQGSRRDSKRKIECAECLELLRSFKRLGASPEELAGTVGALCGETGRMDGMQPLFAEIPGLLDGLKAIPQDVAAKLLQAISGEWAKLRSGSRAKNPTAAEVLPTPPDPEKWTALLKFIIERGGVDPSRNEYYNRELTSLVLALGDGGLLELWHKSSGKSLAGDRRMILRLLEEGRIAEAVALSPEPGRGLNDMAAFTSDTEKLVATLRTDGSSAAFRLAVLISLAHDATKDKVPTEKKTDRLARLMAEYRGMRAGLSLDDRVAMCVALPFATVAIRSHVPDLDEFSIVDAFTNYRRSAGGGKSTVLGALFIPITCSRLHAGDMTGLQLLNAFVSGLPPRDPNTNNARYLDNNARALAGCLCALAIARGGVPDDAVSAGFVAYAKALAKLDTSNMSHGKASLILVMASKDADARAAALKECGLEDVKPSASDSDFGMPLDQGFREDLMKLAILRLDLRNTLLEVLEDSRLGLQGMGEMPLVMGDPGIRAKIPPALFLSWNRDTLRMSAAMLANVEAYSKERRADFDEAQAAEMDGLIDRWKHPEKPLDPKLLEEIRARNAEGARRQMEEIHKRRMEMMRRMNQR